MSELATQTTSKRKLARVLSVQSSVIYGVVGNKAAVFPLQLLGLETDPLNSVQLSNHTGYSLFTGQRLSGDDMWKLVDGLEKNKLLHEYTHVLTGYIGTQSFLERLIVLVKMLKAMNPSIVFVCDPVLGDDDKLYVPTEFVALYRDHLVPLAYLVTPNQTEAELLTGMKLRAEADIPELCAKLHQIGAELVVITSLHSEFVPKDCIYVAASRKEWMAATPRRYLKLLLPKIPKHFSGTGDLVAALLLARLHTDQDFQLALERSMAAVQGVLRRTMDLDRTELALVQSREDLLVPQVHHHAVLVTVGAMQSKL